MSLTADSFRAWREHMGVSQKQLGDWLGTSARTVKNYETGRSEIPRSITLACAALSLGFRDFNGAGDTPTGERI